MSDEVAVRIAMDGAEAGELSTLLPRLPRDVAVRVRDQLWLVAVFGEQRSRINVNERERFDARANAILALLDPAEES